MYETLAVFPFDMSVLLLLEGARSPLLDALAVGLTNIANPLMVMAASAGISALLAGRRRTGDALLVAVGVFGAALVNSLIKLIVQRVRPDISPAIREISYSFPSGHAALSAAFAAAMAVVAWNSRRRWPVLAGGIVLAFFVGLTRIYLGVHYPTDVIGGWMVGAGVVLAARFLLKLRTRQETR